MAVTVPVIPFGIETLDRSLGVGGVPRGRITEIFGGTSLGKTSLALSLVVSAQEHGAPAFLFLDTDGLFDPDLAEKRGVDLSNMTLSIPPDGETALDLAINAVCDGFSVIVDSTFGFTPRSELDGEMGEDFTGLRARLLSNGLRAMAARALHTGSAVVFLSQTRMDTGKEGAPFETTDGTNPVQFYASLRIHLTEVDRWEGGRGIQARTVKNKLAPPFSNGYFCLRHEPPYIDEWYPNPS